MKQLFIYALTFLAVMLPVLYFVILGEKDEKQGSSADPAEEEKKRREKEETPLLFRLLKPFSDLLDTVGTGTLLRYLFPGHSQSLQKKLFFAGLKLNPEDVYCCQMILGISAALAAAGVTALLVDSENRISIPIAALIALWLGSSVPGIVIGNRAQQRRMDILRAIPYSIDLIASAMRGGLDFSAAIRFYVKLGIPGPLTDEYSQMLREMELGVIRITALQNMAERIQIKEFTSFAAAIALGTELGAPLTETMEIQGEEMRKARFALAECKAQRAPSLMLLPMALFILPAVFIIILTPVFLKMREAGVPLF